MKALQVRNGLRIIRINQLKEQLIPIQQELYRLRQGCGTDYPHQVIKFGSAARCAVCDKQLGWYCPDSPEGTCDYIHPWKPEPGNLVTIKEPFDQGFPVSQFVVEAFVEGRVFARGMRMSVPVDILVPGEDEEDEDCCRYCGNPDERK